MKKGKLLAVFAALSLTVGVSAGVLAGCGGGHVHDYSAWDSNETQHWKYCPEDDEIDEESRAEHGAPNAEGKCPDCGYVLHTHTFTEWGSNATQHWKKCPTDGEIDQSTKTNHGTPDEDGKCPDCKYQLVTYVNQSGTLSLRKRKDVTKAASFDDVTITLKHGETTLTEGTDYTLETGTDGAFTFKKIAKATYTLVVEKEGYYTRTQTVAIDGTAALNVTLDYELMEMMPSYYPDKNPPVNGDLDAEFHDFSHVNDENPYIALIGDNRVLNVKTTESYNNFIATFTAQVDKSWHESEQQGFMLFFEGGKVQGFVLQYEENKDGVATKTEIELSGGDICGIGGNAGDQVFNGKWDGYRTWTQEEIAAFKSAKGMQVSLARVGDKLYVLVNGVQRWWYQLPDEVKDEACSIGFWMNGASTNLRFDYSVTDDVEVPVNLIKTGNGTLTATKEKATFDDSFQITVTPDNENFIDKVTINGKEITEMFENESTITVSGAWLREQGILNGNAFTVEAVFKPIERLNSFSATVEVKTLGGVEIDLTGCKVKLVGGAGEFTSSEISEGTVTFTNVVIAKYTAILLDPEGDELFYRVEKFAVVKDDVPEIVFENTVRVYQNSVDVSHVNDKEGYIQVNGTGAMVVESLQTFQNVSITTTGATTTSWWGQVGILMNFSNGKGFCLGTQEWGERAKLVIRAEVRGSVSGDDQNNAAGWVEDLDGCNLLNDEFWAKYSGAGLTFTLVRTGRTVQVIVEDRLVKTLQLAEEYENLDCTVGVYALECRDNPRLPFIVNTDFSGTVEISQTLANGTVTADKSSYNIGEEVTLTVTPAEGYLVESLTVDGMEVVSRLELLTGETTLKVAPKDKELNVNATFATYETVDSYTATVKSQKWGVKAAFAEDTEVTIRGRYGTYKSTVGADGNVTFTNVPAGNYTARITRGGYYSVNVTVEDGATDIEWTFVADNLNDVYKQRANPDFTHLHDEEGYILAGARNGGFVVETKDTFEEVTVTTYLHYNWNDDGVSRFQRLLINFSNTTGFEIGMEAKGADKTLKLFNETHGSAEGHGIDVSAVTLAEGCNPLSESWANEWDSTQGLKLTVARSGQTVKVYVGSENTLVATIDLGADYADLTCTVGFGGLWLAENCNIPFIVRAEVPADFNGQE